MKKLLPTSIAGSLPKPSWLAQPETLWSPWKLEDEALEEGKKDALRVTLQEQAPLPLGLVFWQTPTQVFRDFYNGRRTAYQPSS